MPTARTSESSPLHVAAVTPGDGHGRIGITLCPGKTDPARMSGAWARDLDVDLDVIQRWGATAVASLITDEEFDFLSVRDLPGAVRDRHMEWWYAPIPDGRPPGPDFEDAQENDPGDRRHRRRRPKTPTWSPIRTRARSGMRRPPVRPRSDCANGSTVANSEVVRRRAFFRMRSRNANDANSSFVEDLTGGYHRLNSLW